MDGRMDERLGSSRGPEGGGESGGTSHHLFTGSCRTPNSKIQLTASDDVTFTMLSISSAKQWINSCVLYKYQMYTEIFPGLHFFIYHDLFFGEKCYCFSFS